MTDNNEGLELKVCEILSRSRDTKLFKEHIKLMTNDTKEVITLVQQDLCDKIQTIISDSTIHNAISRIYLIQECLDQMKTEKPPETK